ncbi:hypothetical protein B0H15DRAFT_1018692 [Mycena belliarum]|uniref:Uncharacterized protein n=1 Tax=Mycena belliarum TaxID=1033014 RepID=A0AAD6UGB3_9AGAR|nr:hypothetical protein B0H15DRAFT_1018692 [Mycena belliae]
MVPLLLPQRLNPPLQCPSTPGCIVADAGRKGAGLFAARDDQRVIAHPQTTSRAALCAPQFLAWAADLRHADDMVLFFEEIALSYPLLGDEPRFRIWAQKTVLLCASQDPERAAEFAAWMKGPRIFRLWGWRAKQRILQDGKRTG